MHVALPPRAVWASAGAASFYGISAVSLAFANKAILSGYGWKESNAMLTLQMVVAAAAVQLLAALRLVDLQPLSLSRARTLLPVAFLYASNTAFALASLDGLSLPMYTTLKRMTPAFVLAADAARGKPAGRSTVAAVAVTLLGCVAAGAGDLAFDPKAYAMGTASCALQTAYLVCVASARSGLSSWDLLLYNSLLSAPLLALLCAANGEAGRAAATLPLRLGSFGFAATFGACLVLGVCLNYSIFLCTRLNSGARPRDGRCRTNRPRTHARRPASLTPPVAAPALTTTLVGVMKGTARGGGATLAAAGPGAAPPQPPRPPV